MGAEYSQGHRAAATSSYMETWVGMGAAAATLPASAAHAMMQ